MSVTAQAVEDIIKEEPTKTLSPRKEKNHLKYFRTAVIITVVELNSKNT